jgi:UTP--glucose-1-phosphate uridylyltransferase
MIVKVVIPAAGMGTRLLPATLQQPKEMLPIFSSNSSKQLCLKPLIQLVFEKLYQNNLREFCFVVGKGKRSIEDHFTFDVDLIKHFRKNRKFNVIEDLNQFYEKVRNSKIFFVNQPEPKGFGDALCYAEPFTGNESFLVHAGDDLVLSPNNDYFNRLLNTFVKNKADAAFCVERVEDPRKYGVIQGKQVEKNLFKVTRIDEKPLHPKSNIAIVAVYIFNKRIYRCIRSTALQPDTEVQLTSGIQKLIDEKCDVYAVELSRNEKRIDIGTAHSYWNALNSTFNSI